MVPSVRLVSPTGMITHIVPMDRLLEELQCERVFRRDFIETDIIYFQYYTPRKDLLGQIDGKLNRVAVKIVNENDPFESEGDINVKSKEEQIRTICDLYNSMNLEQISVSKVLSVIENPRDREEERKTVQALFENFYGKFNKYCEDRSPYFGAECIEKRDSFKNDMNSYKEYFNIMLEKHEPTVVEGLLFKFEKVSENLSKRFKSADESNMFRLRNKQVVVGEFIDMLNDIKDEKLAQNEQNEKNIIK